MRITTIFCLLFALGFLGTFAAAQKIEFDHTPGTNFAKYKTYKWGRADKGVYPSRDIDEMFIRSIESELAAKGLSRTEGEADLIVTYQIAIIDDMEWSSASSTIPWVGVVGGAPGIRGASVNNTNMIQKGWFILDFFDVKAHQQVWQAHATKTLSDTTDLRKREKNIQKVMAKIFKGYPPR